MLAIPSFPETFRRFDVPLHTQKNCQNMWEMIAEFCKETEQIRRNFEPRSQRVMWVWNIELPIENFKNPKTGIFFRGCFDWLPILRFFSPNFRFIQNCTMKLTESCRMSRLSFFLPKFPMQEFHSFCPSLHINWPVFCWCFYCKKKRWSPKFWILN